MNHALNILLVEDNDDDVFLLQEAFKKSGATGHLHRVSDGLEALEYLNGEGPYSDKIIHPAPDILLLDLNMPRMNGFEVLERLRRDAQWSRLMVHVLTASPREADVQRAYDLRANSYVVKPGRVAELIEFASVLHQWHRFIAFPRASALSGSSKAG